MAQRCRLIRCERCNQPTISCAACRYRGIMSPITLRHACTYTRSRCASTLCRVIPSSDKGLVERQGRSMSDHRVYRDYNNDLGNHLLILRTRTALTQIALAEQIGVHRHSVQRWETGLSYPKPELLQRLIAVFLRHQAFTPGNERAEALALWEQAAHDGPHPLPPFDEVWFARTLALQNALPLVPAQEVDREGEHISSAITATQPATSHAIMDWGEAIAVPTLYGRADELQTLQQWVIEDHCRVVAIVGIGGMGKSSLAITFAYRVVSQFEVVLFRRLAITPE